MAKTLEFTMDEAIFQRVEQATKKIGISITEFIQQAVEDALRRFKIAEMEKRQIEGYQRYPATPDEFAVWETEQAWGQHEAR